MVDGQSTNNFHLRSWNIVFIIYYLQYLQILSINLNVRRKPCDDEFASELNKTQ